MLQEKHIPRVGTLGLKEILTMDMVIAHRELRGYQILCEAVKIRSELVSNKEILMPKTQKAGGGSKKIGRDKKKCERYKLARTREKNKERKKLRYEIKMEKTKARKLKRLKKKKQTKAEASVPKKIQDA